MEESVFDVEHLVQSKNTACSVICNKISNMKARN